nr:hypothetical protein [Angustibacter aerolatus]
MFRAAWQPLDDAVALLAALEAEGALRGGDEPLDGLPDRQARAHRAVGPEACSSAPTRSASASPSRGCSGTPASLIGTEPSRTVYVGNDLTVDAEGALAAGLQAVWLDRGIDHRGGRGRRPGTRRRRRPGHRPGRRPGLAAACRVLPRGRIRASGPWPGSISGRVLTGEQPARVPLGVWCNWQHD